MTPAQSDPQQQLFLFVAKALAEGLVEGLGKVTTVTGMLGGWTKKCNAGARGLDKTVTGVLGGWTGLPETTWNFPGASANLPEHSVPGGFLVRTRHIRSRSPLTCRFLLSAPRLDLQSQCAARLCVTA